MNGTKPSSIYNPAYGMDMPEETAVKEVFSTLTSTDPKEIAEKVEKLTNIAEELNRTGRDNNAIICQLLFSMEERIYKRIEEVRLEMLTQINRTRTARPAPRGSIVETDKMSSSSSITKIDEEEDLEFEMTKVLPSAGFVIKTRKLLGTKEKVFVNVFHDDKVELVPAALPRGTPEDKPYIIMHDNSTVPDKEGNLTLVYNIAVSSEYFKLPNPKIDVKITSPACIQKIIHKINLKAGDFLDEGNYSLPRTTNGYKGDDIPIFSVALPRVSKIQKPLIMQQRPSNLSDSNFSNYNDNESVLSEITEDISPMSLQQHPASRNNSFVGSVTGGTGGKRAARKKSFFDGSQLGYSGGTIVGRNLLSGNMLDFIKEESLDHAAANHVIEESNSNPGILLGFQISLEVHDRSEIYVVTDFRKNYLHKTEFRLSRFKQSDIWVRLARQEGKSGNKFRPLRKVLFNLGDESSMA